MVRIPFVKDPDSCVDSVGHASTPEAAACEGGRVGVSTAGTQLGGDQLP